MTLLDVALVIMAGGFIFLLVAMAVSPYVDDPEADDEDSKRGL